MFSSTEQAELNSIISKGYWTWPEERSLTQEVKMLIQATPADRNPFPSEAEGCCSEEYADGDEESGGKLEKKS
ncbi:hypothetical protein ACH5RR_026148 [Cinchona calisaya]|uniref:Uncharacterized protein n=1 Tax=Cinchona calisaya TaxID=153742 RepID=A0ABD2Z3M2_9GENT